MTCGTRPGADFDNSEEAEGFKLLMTTITSREAADARNGRKLANQRSLSGGTIPSR